jgi:hypothetical protein
MESVQLPLFVDPHSDHIYPLWAKKLYERFDGVSVLIIPIEHGGAREAIKLKKYTKPNFHFFQKPGARRPEENCIDQLNRYNDYAEVRKTSANAQVIYDYITTLPGGKVHYIVFLDSEAKTEGAPSLSGALDYGIRNASTFNVSWRDILTTVKIDYVGAADIAAFVDPYARRFSSMLDYMKNFNLDTYAALIKDGCILADPDHDAIFMGTINKRQRRKLSKDVKRGILPQKYTFIKACVRNLFSA